MLCGAALCVALTAAAVSPYMARVYEFTPAPGQFINEVPETDPDLTYTPETILPLVEEQLCGEERPGMVSLGAFGGYIVFGFDHPLVNVAGQPDMMIYGNAILSDREAGAGSAEPGIISVSVDANGNGLPDDPWFELAGSDYSLPSTIKGCEITYYRPAADHTPVADPANTFIVDKEYIRWTSPLQDPSVGYVPRNSFHSQDYWPCWLTDKETLTFTGTRLKDNAVNVGTDEQPYYRLAILDYGYVDNKPNDEETGFNLDWAVDGEGNPVKLTHADFIRVHTGVCAANGWIGEVSTELCGARDLHPDATSVVNLSETATTPVAYYTLTGARLTSAPTSGPYIARYADGTARTLIK